MKQLIIPMLAGGLILSCQQKGSDVQPVDPQPIEAQKQTALAKKLEDNRLLDLPTFDDSNVDRQLPYSSAVASKRPRLLRVNSLTYRYDSLGRVLEGYTNFIGTDIKAVRHVYEYDKQGLQQVSFYWGAYPGSILSLTNKFTFFTNRAGKTDSYYDGTSAYQLRFDQSGHLIWSGLLKNQNSPVEVKGYSRAIRDADHNVRLLRSTLEKVYTTEYEYDNKPNPYYQFEGTPGFTSPNNVVKETKRDISGNIVSVTEYTYDYRADGYPVRKHSGSDVVDYVYTN